MGPSLYVEDVDEDLWKLLDADSRTKKEIVEAALWREFGGRKVSALEAKKQHKKQQLQAVEQELEKEREDYERIQQEIDALDAKIEKMENESVAYEVFLDSLLDDLEAGEISHLVPAVITARDEFDQLEESPQEIREDAKQRAAAQERELHTTDFMSFQEAQRVSGVPDPISDAVEDGDSE